MSTTLNARIRTAEAAKESPDDRLPCHFCATPTLRATLSQYGARCYGCYQQWMQQPIPGRNWPQAGRKPTQAELVERLETRKAEGEALSMAQLEWLDQAKRKLNHGSES